jgi:hypothetical protein
MDTTKINVLNNIIGINPTGRLEYTGTYKLLGNNNVVKSGDDFAQANLEKSQNNEYVCNNIEKFENYRDYENIEINYKENNSKNKILYNIFVLLLLLIFFVFILYKF